MALPILLPVAVVVMAVSRTRPSTVLRHGEDGIIYGATTVRNGVSRFSRAVRIEYGARQVARAAKHIERTNAKLEAMDLVERAQYERDVDDIMARARQLRGL